nr:DUF6602 domain-containing protein [Allomuricauda sp.]
MINPLKFQKSINRELQVVKNRVRNLIGSANWGDEGSYKEAILRNVISQYLPKNLSVGNGYILKKGNNNGNQDFAVSKQIDILIYDNSYPVIFSEGNFVIVIEESVKGIIEVKSKIYTGRTNSSSLYRIIEKFNTFDQFLNIRENENNRIFKGVFGYEFDGNLNSDTIDTSLRLSNGMVNHISLNSSIFIRHWINNEGLDPPVNCGSHFYNVYNINNLSHAYFISNLIHITSNKDLVDRYWISFPIPGTKERNRDRTICLDE